MSVGKKERKRERIKYFNENERGIKYFCNEAFWQTTRFATSNCLFVHIKEKNSKKTRVHNIKREKTIQIKSYKGKNCTINNKNEYKEYLKERNEVMNIKNNFFISDY